MWGKRVGSLWHSSSTVRCEIIGLLELNFLSKGIIKLPRILHVFLDVNLISLKSSSLKISTLLHLKPTVGLFPPWRWTGPPTQKQTFTPDNNKSHWTAYLSPLLKIISFPSDPKKGLQSLTPTTQGVARGAVGDNYQLMVAVVGSVTVTCVTILLALLALFFIRKTLLNRRRTFTYQSGSVRKHRFLRCGWFFIHLFPFDIETVHASRVRRQFCSSTQELWPWRGGPSPPRSPSPTLSWNGRTSSSKTSSARATSDRCLNSQCAFWQVVFRCAWVIVYAKRSS